MTDRVALITGASSGIGLELVRLFAHDGHDLVLVARREEGLRELAEQLMDRYDVRATVIAADLADPAAPPEIARRVAAAGLEVEFLVNNAGFGLAGEFTRTDVTTELRMIQVNVAALTHLTKLFLPGMVAEHQGAVLNVASTAGFVPGPLMAVYYATKAYVISFSEALAEEFRNSGVTVTVLCPGATRTEFQERAGIDLEARMFRGPWVADAASVARAGYDGMRRGKRLVVPGLFNKVMVAATRLASRALLAKAVRRVQESVRS
ncbi:MAG TPA: SDR family oxidoreductase [Gemmatimonadales bacterium]|nr:SDR family oxidoreductase [Gemmatimonadales bacterium]